MSSIDTAIKICKIIESFAPLYGCHVALTGGCLYKDGERKDVDILFYRIRQTPEIDMTGLLSAIEYNGFTKPVGFGWVYKSMFDGVNIDMFFPESSGDEEYDPAVDYRAALNAILMASQTDKRP